MDGDTKFTDLLEDKEVVEHKAHEDGAIDKDFYDKIKPWERSKLDDLERRFYSRPWFGKAWQEYRSHVLGVKQKDIRRCGYVFTKYIADDENISSEEKEYLYLGDDYMWYELRTEKERMCDCAHSIEIGKDYLMHYNDNHDPKTGQFAPKDGSMSNINRYVTKNGELTEAGRARYGKAIKEMQKNTGFDEKTAAKYIVNEGLTKDISDNVSTSADIVRGVGSVAKQTADLIPSHTGKTVHGSYPNLSNQELNERVNRMNLEQRYSDLKGDTKYVPSGKDKAREALQTISAFAVLGATIIGIANGIMTIKNRKTPDLSGGK